MNFHVIHYVFQRKTRKKELTSSHHCYLQQNKLNMNKKEIIQAIKTFKKALKKGSPKTVWKSSYWDIHERLYTVDEIAARFLRMKGYNVRIEIGDNTENSSYCFGYIRFYRYVAISFN